MRNSFHHHVLIHRITRNLIIGAAIIFISLLLGMVGYRFFENYSWIDSFLNASMILSGMGQINPIQTNAGKLFAGSYALFSGAVFLISLAVIFSPIFHRIVMAFHLEDTQQNTKKK